MILFFWISTDPDDPDIAKNVIGSHTIIGELKTNNSGRKKFHYFKKVLSLNPPYIWAIKGGHLISNVLYLLEKNEAKPSSSIFVGFSDCTFLHMWYRAHQKPSVHGMMPYFCKQAFGKHQLSCNCQSEFSFDPLKKRTHAFRVLYNPKNEVSVISSVIGGNVACLHAQIGTKTQLQADKQIVLLEEVHETLEDQIYFLKGLIDAKTFENAEGILLGDMSEPEKIANFIHQRYPDLWIIYSHRFGHGDFNDFLPLGYETHVNFKTQTFVCNTNKVMPYCPIKFERSIKIVTGERKILDLIALNGGHKVKLHPKSVLTEKQAQWPLRFTRSMISLVRAGTIQEKAVVYVKKHVVDDKDKAYCERELKDICKLKIKWV